MKQHKITLLLCLLLLAACGDHNHDDHDGHDHGKKETTAADASHDHEDEGIATLTQEQIKMAGIETGVIEQKNLTGTIKISGVLKVPNENRGVATSMFAGTIKTLLIIPGSSVRKGQVLATIANADFANIQQQYIENKARLDLAQLERQRQEQLVAGNAAPRKNLERATAEWKAAQSIEQALRQQMKLMGIQPGKISTTINVLSPVNGTISNIMAQIGSPVDASTPIAEIVNNEELHLDAFVYEQDLDKVKKGQEINFTLTNNASTKIHHATIFTIGTAFEKETKAIPIHAHVTGGTAGLMEGMNVTGVLNVNNSTMPAIPTEAIVNYEGQDYILAATEKENSYEKIPVARGTTDMGYTSITLLKALTPDTRIITKGAFYVLAMMTNKGEAHSH